MDKAIQRTLTDLHQRCLHDGGFAERPAGQFRPDATAWAVLALSAVDRSHESIDPARLSLSRSQLADGRIPLTPEHPQACWPTPLAALAWTNTPGYEQSQKLAIAFLLNFTGVHGEKAPNSPLAHNTALKGWPWIAGTHSWVEPTALSIIALRSAGQGNHPRVLEAVEMLLDRQLPDGGWNYGNTEVYGQELNPMPDSTGLALAALAGVVGKNDIIRSIDYLSKAVSSIRSPFSLSWGLLGLSAWRYPTAKYKDLVFQCLENQTIRDTFTTTHLCLLLLATQDIADHRFFQIQESQIDQNPS